MKTQPHFLKDSSVYLVANVINAAIPFFLLPFLTHKLSAEDYGLVAMFQVLTTAVMPLIGLNFDSTFARYYFEFDTARIKSFISNGLVMTFFTSILTAVIFLIVANTISDFSEFPKPWLWTIVLFSFAQKSFDIFLTLLRVQYKALQYGVLRILKTTLEIGLSILIILFIESTWKGRIEGQLVASAFFGVYSIFIMLRLINWKLSTNKADLNTLFKYGVPLIPHELGAFIIAYSDRLFIMNMVGPEQTGLYSVGYQFGMIIALLQNSFNQAWVPYFFEILTRDRMSDKFKIIKITYVYFIIILLLVVGLVISLPVLFLFIGKDFASAMQFVLWIALGFAFNGMYKMVVNYLFYAKKTHIIGILTFSTAILNIILNYFLILQFGAIGSAYATCIAFFIQFAITWLICIRIYKMPWLLKVKS